MGKRFNFKVSRVIPSFQSCRPKDPSSLPSNPVPSFSTLAPATANAIAALKLNHHPPPPPSSKHLHQSSIKRHVSSALLLARRSFLPSRSSRVPSHPESESSKWHVITKLTDYDNYHFTPPRPKIYTSAANSDDLRDDVNQNDVVLFPPLNLKNRTRRLSRRRRRARTFQKVRISTSSDNNDVIFSDNDNVIERDNETDTLVSTDDSASHRRQRNRSSGYESPATAPARLSEFMKGMATCQEVEGKVRESFAVVKRSEDPYEDFKRSMAEMVVEKELFDMVELEELLRCYLSLNSVHHHEAIVRAFSEIWEAMFNKNL